MPDHHHGAQRASSRKLRSLLTGVFAALLLATATTATAPEAQAATKRVVIVVGPVGSATENYRDGARQLASQARSYGASVTSIFSPYATWARVSAAAKGANVLIYLGHGNGYPSPYGAFNARTKNGMGLNSSDGSSSHTYYGEYYIDRDIQMAKNAVVILNRLCYASGNNEWGAGYPSQSTAKQRVDGYGAGFLRAGAQAVFAEGIDSTSYILYGLFKTDRTIRQIFWSDPARDGRWDFSFASSRTPGYHAEMDPLDGSNRYYRSVVGNLDLTAKQWRTVLGKVSTGR